jgi:hypothetical protein
VAVDASEQQTIAALLREDTPPKDEPDYSDRLLQALLRQAALTGRYAASGVGGMGAAFANPLAYGANKGLEAVGSDYRFPEQHGALMGALTDMGVPKPQGTMEKAVGFASEIGVPDPTDSAKLVSSLSHMIDPNGGDRLPRFPPQVHQVRYGKDRHRRRRTGLRAWVVLCRVSGGG